MHDFGIEHELGRAVVVEYDDALAHADHVRRHAHAAVPVRGEGVQ